MTWWFCGILWSILIYFDLVWSNCLQSCEAWNINHLRTHQSHKKKGMLHILRTSRFWASQKTAALNSFTFAKAPNPPGPQVRSLATLFLLQTSTRSCSLAPERPGISTGKEVVHGSGSGHRYRRDLHSCRRARSSPPGGDDTQWGIHFAPLRL